MNWVGRINCDGPSDKGPSRIFPSSNLDTAGLIHFFSQEFGFDAEETIAIMGAHTIGVLNRRNSGFDGPGGWTPNNFLLDNGYFNGLINQKWNQKRSKNGDLSNISDQFQWERGKDGPNDNSILLNVDVAIVNDITAKLNVNTGEVRCGFAPQKGDGKSGKCPWASLTRGIAQSFSNDNTLWLKKFEQVMTKMTNHGYNSSEECLKPPCKFPHT